MSTWASFATGTTVWPCWIATGSTITSTIIATQTVTATWTGWVTIPTLVITQQWAQWNARGDAAAETKEQQRLRVAAEAQQRAQYLRKEAERAKVRDAAKHRARKLLVDHLSPEQRESYEKKGFFYLFTKERCYRIDQGTHGNVKLVEADSKKVLGSYCIQPNGVPDEDAMLAQKLHLEICEEEFIARANFSRWNARAA